MQQARYREQIRDAPYEFGTTDGTSVSLDNRLRMSTANTNVRNFQQLNESREY